MRGSARVATVIAAACLAAGCGGGEDVDASGQATVAEETATTSTTVGTGATTGGSMAAMDCVEAATPENLGRRSFAFDGVVAEVSEAVDPRMPAEDPAGQVVPRAVFDVAIWYRGGGPAEVSVWMQRDVVVGERLLVSGEPRWGGDPLDDAIAWECGFTEAYSSDVGAVWDAVFTS